MPKSKVFLDANALWKARLYRRAYATAKESIHWAGRKIERPVIQPGKILVFEKQADQWLEAMLLEKVARLAKAGKIRLITHNDAKVASLLRARGGPYCPEGEFYGASVEEVDCGVPHSRVIGGGSRGEFQAHDFSNPRFRDMCKLTGAIQGEAVVAPRQVPDAFLLYCAEENGATHFVTLDGPLIHKARDLGPAFNLTKRVCWPSELLGEFLRYWAWPLVARFVKRNQKAFSNRIGYLLRRADVIVQETDKVWHVIDRKNTDEWFP